MSLKALRKRGITPCIARRGIDSGEKLGRYRWAVERTLSWVNRFRRLKVRYERRDDIQKAFLDLGCSHLLALRQAVMLGALNYTKTTFPHRSVVFQWTGNGSGRQSLGRGEPSLPTSRHSSYPWSTNHR